MTVLGVNTTPAPGVTVAFANQTAGVGTISNAGAGSGAITGTGTQLLNQFRPGDTIVAGSETQTVIEVTSNTAMTTTPFTGALSGASFTVGSASRLRWQLQDNGCILGPDTAGTPGTTTALINYTPSLTMNNGSTNIGTGIAQFNQKAQFSGTGSSDIFGLRASATVARTNVSGRVTGSGVEGRFFIGGNNTQDWSPAIPGFLPAGVRGNFFSDPVASGTIAVSSGVMASVDATGCPNITLTKSYGYLLAQVNATNLVTGIGAGLYNVNGTNRAYLMLSGSSSTALSGQWAIYDDTNYPSLLSGPVKIGASATQVIDANGILYQYGVALPKNNNTATLPPAATDDTAAGYSVGSVWFQPSTGRSWRLRDATTGAAKWVEIALAQAPSYISGNWYMAPDMTVAAGVPAAADAIQFVPLLLKERVTLASLGVRITTAEHAGSIQLALYANNPATGHPTGNAVATTASISTGATGPVSAAIAGGNVTLEPGLYWAGFNLDTTAGGLVAVQVPATDNHPTAALIGSASQANLGASGAGDLVSLHVAQTFGTWPSLTSATFVEGSTPSRNGPAMQFKVA